jgi:predicted transcriptional regulator
LLSETKIKILEIVSRAPIRFTDLVRKLELTKKRVAVHLNELEAKGSIKKNTDGLYEITSVGEIDLRLMREQERISLHYGAMSALAYESAKARKLDRLALKRGLEDIGAALIGLTIWAEAFHQHAVQHNPQWKASFDFELLLNKASGAGSFFHEAAGILGFKDLPEASLFASKWIPGKLKADTFKEYTKKDVEDQLLESAQLAIDTCKKVETSYKDSLGIVHTLDVIIRDVEDVREYLLHPEMSTMYGQSRREV